MNITRTICTAAFFLAALGFCPAAHCADAPQKKLVRDFYLWYGAEYLALDATKKSPVSDDAIFAYVSTCTVNRLRIDQERDFIDWDYFLTGNDFWPELLEGMTVMDPIPITATVSIVPVCFPVRENEAHVVLAFVKTEGDSHRIIKVEDTY